MRKLLCLLALAPLASASAQIGDPPHAFLFGSWTGGLFPPGETRGPDCAGQPTVVFTRDVVLRASITDVAYRQRLVETAAGVQGGIEFRFIAVPAQQTPFGPRLPSDLGFGCPGGPNTLSVRRVSEDEIVFPDCAEFPSPLRRCVWR
jgi:hypothetical protein